MGAGFWEGDTDTDEVGIEETAEAEAIMAEIEADAVSPAGRAATSERISRATSEAEVRFEKANLYRTLLQGSLFEENSGGAEIVAEVEAEIKDFVLERFETLIGIRAPEEEGGGQADGQFSPEEAEALRFLAKRIRGGAQAPKAAPRPPVPAIRKATPAPRPVLRTAQKPPQAAAPAAPTQKPRIKATAEVVRGVAALAKKQGKKVVTLPDGRIGKISIDPRVQVQPPNTPSAPRPLPMPSAEEQMGKAMVEASMNASGHPIVNAPGVFGRIMKNAAARVAAEGGEED